MPAAIKAIPVRHPWRWVTAVVVVAIVAWFIYTIITAPLLNWDVVQQYVFYPLILEGLEVTLALTVLAMLIGIGLGVILAVMRVSDNPVLSALSWFYLWFFRGTPALVQIFFWYNLNIILPHVGIVIPGTPIHWMTQTREFINPFVAATLALGLNEAAYMAEIVRAGIISIENGQIDAAQALGMPGQQVMRRIILPQAVRVIIPPTGNETINMLKGTSLAFVATVPELFTRAQQISNVTYDIVEMLIVISLWYLFMYTLLTIGQYYVERYFAKGGRRELPLTPFQRLRRFVGGLREPPSAAFVPDPYFREHPTALGR